MNWLSDCEAQLSNCLYSHILLIDGHNITTQRNSGFFNEFAQLPAMRSRCEAQSTLPGDREIRESFARRFYLEYPAISRNESVMRIALTLTVELLAGLDAGLDYALTSQSVTAFVNSTYLPV